VTKPHLRRGDRRYAGVDYGEILEQAQKECDVLIWTAAQRHAVLTPPPTVRPCTSSSRIRPARGARVEATSPAETNFRMADVIVINKIDRRRPSRWRRSRGRGGAQPDGDDREGAEPGDARGGRGVLRASACW